MQWYIIFFKQLAYHHFERDRTRRSKISTPFKMGGKCWSSRPAHSEFIRLPLRRQRTNAIDGVANQLWWIEGVPYVLSFRSCTSLSTHFWAPPPTRQNAATPGSCSSTCPYCRPSGEWRSCSSAVPPFGKRLMAAWILKRWRWGGRADTGRCWKHPWFPYPVVPLIVVPVLCYTWKRVSNATLLSLRFSQV